MEQIGQAGFHVVLFHHRHDHGREDVVDDFQKVAALWHEDMPMVKFYKVCLWGFGYFSALVRVPIISIRW